jgi:glycosyltransferase involved in cell wall biosynthesis
MQSMKRVAIIGTVGVPGRYGGFETLAHQLVDHLSGEFEFKVYCSSQAYSKNERVKHFNGVRLYYLPFNANGIQSIIYDYLSILHALFVSDIMVILGVSGCTLIPFIRLFTNKKIIVNIDGLEWKRQKWNYLAKLFLKFSEGVAVKWSHADITDNEAIQRYTSIQYGTLSTLIEYGGNHVLKVSPTNRDAIKYPFVYGPYAFKVSRIEPENNIHIVLEAFAGLKQMLVIVGNWNKSSYGKDLKKSFSIYRNIKMLDPIYNQRELDVLRSNCLLYIHGHSAGGTNPSLVEAMNLSLPVLAFDCEYNRATTENEAIYFSDSKSLKKVVNRTSLKELMEMRIVMEEIASRRYTWNTIAMKYSNLIHAFDYQYEKQNLWSNISKLEVKTLLKNGLAHLKRPTHYKEEL